MTKTSQMTPRKTTPRKTSRTLALLLAATAGLAAAGMVPRSAEAGSNVNLRIDVRGGNDDFCRPGPVETVRYENRTTQVWVEPVYRTVCDRVWVEPVTRTVEDRVWVPARYETRRVERHDRNGRCYTVTQRVLVEPAHYETRCREAVVRQGHWDNIERQELVTPGHYEYRTEQVAVPVRPVRQVPGGYFSVTIGR